MPLNGKGKKVKNIRYTNCCLNSLTPSTPRLLKIGMSHQRLIPI